MTKYTNINQPVAVTAMGFGRNLQTFPRRIELDGASYTFVDAGIRAVIKRGSAIAQVITMSDGERLFRLKSDGRSSNWTLLGISQ